MTDNAPRGQVYVRARRRVGAPEPTAESLRAIRHRPTAYVRRRTALSSNQVATSTAVTPPTSAPQPLGPHAPAFAILALTLAIIGAVMLLVSGPDPLSIGALLLSLVLAIVAIVRKRSSGRPAAALALAIAGLSLFVSTAAAINSAVSPTVVAEPEVVWSDPLPDAPPGADYGPVQPLQLVETATGRYGESADWWFAVIVDNPNEDYVFDADVLEVIAFDADGEELGSSTEFPVILQGRTAVAGSLFDIGTAEIDHLEVRLPSHNYAKPSPGSDTGAFVIRGLEATRSEYSTTATGEVSGTFPVDLPFVQVVTIARDPAGEIIGAERGYVEDLAAGDQWAPFEILFPDPLPVHSFYEAYASL